MMGSSPLDLYAREYFTSLNSITEKLSADITNAVAAYEDLWHTLSIKDQHQIINETIIHPNVVLKYTLCQPDEYNLENKVPSLGYFAEEGKVLSWPDEHAAPFSWKTLSQQDLSVFGDGEINSYKIKMEKDVSMKKAMELVESMDNPFDPPNIVLGGSSSKLVAIQNDNSSNFSIKNKSKSVVLRVQTTVPTQKKDHRHKAHSMTESDNIVKHTGLSKSSRTFGKSIAKPKSPPPPPPPKQRVNSSGISGSNKDGNDDSLTCQVSKNRKLNISQTNVSLDSLSEFNVDVNLSVKSDGLPKTGFDFLDNW